MNHFLPTGMVHASSTHRDRLPREDEEEETTLIKMTMDLWEDMLQTYIEEYLEEHAIDMMREALKPKKAAAKPKKKSLVETLKTYLPAKKAKR